MSNGKKYPEFKIPAKESRAKKPSPFPRTNPTFFYREKVKPYTGPKAIGGFPGALDLFSPKKMYGAGSLLIKGIKAIKAAKVAKLPFPEE